MNPNTWISFLTSVIGMAGAAAATDGLISGKMGQTIASAAGMIVPIIWGKISHSDSAVVKAASWVDGVATPILIAPEAPEALQALARDNTIPMVKSAAPAPSPYATSQRRT